VVRRRFSNEIRQWVLEEVIREGWEEAKTSESLKPISDPSVRNLKFEEGQPVEFEWSWRCVRSWRWDGWADSA
jgi:FKBP-type peptidyl-prolyl cis-trans isomerase (trigger factor)